MREKLLTILSDIRPDIDFETEKGFISEGILESFDLLQLIATLENEFGVEIGNKNVTIENFDTFDRILSLIERLQG